MFDIVGFARLYAGVLLSDANVVYMPGIAVTGGGGPTEHGISNVWVAQSSVGSLNEDIRALFEECLSKVRRQDSPASWKAIEDRIAALRERMDQIYGEAPCAHSGAIRPTK